MKYKLMILALAGASIVGCGGSNNPAAMQAAGENAGIAASYRAGNSVILLYQKASTTSSMLQAEANRVCAKGGQRAGSSSPMSVGGANKIPGVDAKIAFTCF